MKKVNYKPSNDEHFMSPRQLRYFRDKLMACKEKLLDIIANEESNSASEDHSVAGDVVDRANDALMCASSATHRQHEEETLCALEKALGRIESGTYGYCEVTGEPISLARLDAFPAATMSLEAQESLERTARVTRLPNTEKEAL